MGGCPFQSGSQLARRRHVTAGAEHRDDVCATAGGHLSTGFEDGSSLEASRKQRLPRFTYDGAQAPLLTVPAKVAHVCSLGEPRGGGTQRGGTAIGRLGIGRR